MKDWRGLLEERWGFTPSLGIIHLLYLARFVGDGTLFIHASLINDRRSRIKTAKTPLARNLSTRKRGT